MIRMSLRRLRGRRGDADEAVCANPTDADPKNGTSDYETSSSTIAKRWLRRG